MALSLPFLFILLSVAGSLAWPMGKPPCASPKSGITTRSSPTVLLVGKLRDVSDEERAIEMERARKTMTSFTNKYLQMTSTKLCADKSVAAVVIEGLAEHKVNLGAPLCPCRFYDNKEKEATDGFWNCPCVPMRERQECHCMLFLTDDNDFVGDSQEISVDEVEKFSAGMQG